MPTSPRTALVTGGAKRVGRAIVVKLLEEGFNVAFTYNTSGDEAQSLIDEYGPRVLATHADLTSPVDATEEIRRRFASFGNRLDLLVNNASLYEPAPLNRTDTDLMRRVMAIHFEAPLLLIRAFTPLLRSAHGHIVNMVDVLAERPWPRYLAYCASKAALANLTLGLARELAPDINVNGIAPGVVEWPENYPEEEKQPYLQRVPLNRAGAPRDVANLVHFLATSGNYITGQIIRLDGGRSIT